MQILDAAVVADAGMKPVTPTISDADSQAYLAQVDKESRLHSDIIVKGTYTLDTDIETYGRVIVSSGTLNLNGHTLHSHGKMEMSGGTVDLNGGVLTVDEDLIQSGGTMVCNKGTLNVEGDYRIQTAATDGDGKTTYGDSDGCLQMEHDTDCINIQGNFVTQSNNSRYQGNIFSAGTINLKGDFTQNNSKYYGYSIYDVYNNFSCRDTHKVVLCGDGVQTVTFQSGQSYFNELAVGDRTKLYWKGHFVINPLQHDLTVYNDITMSEENLDLNGHTLTIKGDLIQSGGTMICNKGTLNVEGDYRIQTATTDDNGKITYKKSSGVLRMTNEMDKVNVSGNFVMQSNWSCDASSTGYNCFSAGTLTVKGNFSQLDGSNYNFAASGTHKVVLDGEDTQNVTFESKESHFNELVITKALDTGYTFNRTPCWIKLTQLVPGTVEGSVTTDDLTTPVTIRILRDSVEVAKTTSDDGSYRINDLSDGIYTMEISKPGYVTRRCTIELKDRKPILGLEVELVVCGNVNGATTYGKAIDASDVQCLYEILALGKYDSSCITDKDYLNDVADVNMDGSVDVYDLQLLYENVCSGRT